MFSYCSLFTPTFGRLAARFSKTVLVLSLVALLPLSARAANIVVGDPLIPPAENVAGNSFHLTFVSSTTQQVPSTVIATYNTLVQGLANASSITGLSAFSWDVIGSTTSVDANVNAVVSAPVYRLDDVQVATGFADFWDGSHGAVMSFNENGVLQAGNTSVFTGTLIDGTKAPNQENLGNEVHKVMRGFFDQSGNSWTDSPPTVGWDNVYRLYALSEQINVVEEIPEPGTIGLMMLGLAGMFCSRRKLA